MTKSKAEYEFDLLEKRYPGSGNDRPIVLDYRDEILALIRKFNESGQSGGSAPYTASVLSEAVKHLCLQEPLGGLTGEDWEWNDVSEMMGGHPTFQNNRLSSVFKDGLESIPYYLEAIIWQGPEEYDTFTGTVEGVQSSAYIKSFPFYPKRFYVDCVKSAPTKEEFDARWDYANEDAYVYCIKDPKQLEKVKEYYDLRIKETLSAG